MHDSTLYFPTIEFRSPSVLKASLLVWDRVYRIVPSSYTPSDSDDVRIAIDEGLIRSVELEDQDVRNTASAFEDFLYGLDSIPAGFHPGGPITDIHLEKIDSRLYPVLEGLAEQMSDDWIGLPAEVARGYMLMLATEIAKRRQLALITDDDDAWIAASFINEDGLFSDYVHDVDVPYQFCQFGIPDVLPWEAGSLDMKKLVKLSRETRDDRADFRKQVTELAERVSQCESRSHAEDLVADYRRSLGQSTESLKKQYGFLRRGEGHSLLSVGLPVSTSLLASLLTAGLHSVPLIGGAVTISLVGALADSWRTAPRTDRVTAYLLGAQKATGRRRDLRDQMEEFIND